MSENTYTVISTAITQEIPDDFQITLFSESQDVMRPRVRTIFKMEVYINGEVLGYEAEIPAVTMTRRFATDSETLLAYELNEVARRHELREFGNQERDDG